MIKNRFLKRVGALVLAMSMIFGSGVVNAADENPSSVNPAMIDTAKDVTFTIHKYEMETLDGAVTPGDGTVIDASDLPDEAAPLAGVTFSLYKVADDAVETTLAEGATAVAEKTTDENGIATFKIAAKDQGRYLVVETAYPEKVYEKSANFLVDLPMMSQDSASWNYDVHAYPKNAAVLGAVQLTKLDKDDNTKLKGAVFKLQKETNKGFEDMLDEAGKVRTFVTDADGKISVTGLVKAKYQFVEVTPPEDYGIDTTPISFEISKNADIDKDGKLSANVVKKTAYDVKTPIIKKSVDKDSVDINQKVTWTITPSVPSDIETYKKYVVTDTIDNRLEYQDGTLKVKLNGTAITKGFDASVQNGKLNVTFSDFAMLDGKTLTIEFETKVLANTIDNPGHIYNQAQVEYENAFGTTGSAKSDKVSVYVGNIRVVKVDEKDDTRKLSGAEFVLYRTKADAESGKNPVGETVATNEKGEAYFKGLAAGDYWIVETKAPTFVEKDNTVTRYLLMSEAKKVTVSKDDKDGIVTIGITNRTEGFTIPKTGGTGTMIILLAGLLLVSGVTIVLVLRKRRSAK